MVSNYNSICKYSIDKLDNVVYLIDGDALKDIRIDGGEAYVSGITQAPTRLNAYNINLSDSDELDERYKFTHTLTFSMKGYVNYKDFIGKYYAIIKSLDGTYWLVNPLFPCKVTYTYTLDANGSHTDFTMATISNHPTLKINGMGQTKAYECGYSYCTFKSLKLNENKYSIRKENHAIYTNSGFKEIAYNKNSAALKETFDGNNVSHQIDFNIRFDGDDWYYDLLEFVDNKYAAIIETSCGKYIMTGFGFGLQPSYKVAAATNNASNNVQISLTDLHDNGDFIGYYDTITISKIGSTSFVYTTDYDGYECVGASVARYLLQKKIDAFGNNLNEYKCLVGYESQFSFLNIVGTFNTTQEFQCQSCLDNCRITTSIPSQVIFNDVSSKHFAIVAEGNWSISSSNNHITVSPSTGTSGTTNITVANSITPTSSITRATLYLNYCDEKQNTYEVIVKEESSCFPTTTYEINGRAQYVNVLSYCDIDSVSCPDIIAHVEIQYSGFRVYVPQNNEGANRTIMLVATTSDGDSTITINQSPLSNSTKWKAIYESGITKTVSCEENYIQENEVPRTLSGASILALEINDCVVNIREKSLSGFTTLKSITIPNSLKTIANSAFKGCSSIESIYIPSGVTRIHNDTFSGCTSLTSATISSGITTIGNNAFRDCPNLIYVRFESTTPPNIGDYVFANSDCPIYVPCSAVDTYKGYSVEWGRYASRIQGIEPCVAPVEMKWLATYRNYDQVSGECDTSSVDGIVLEDLIMVDIYGCATSIASEAFDNASALTMVSLENASGLTSIGDKAFYNCDALGSIVLPSGVTTIGDEVFKHCGALTLVELGNVTTIGVEAFEHCTALTSITIPSSVTSIEGGAFYGDTSLTSITFSGLTPPQTIGNNAFHNTNNCPIYVSCSAETQYREAMPEYTSRIQGVGECPEPTEFKWMAVYTGGTTQSAPCDSSIRTISSGEIPNITGLTSLTVGECVLTIGYQALQYADLQALVLSHSETDGVQTIGENAFDQCSNLTSIDFSYVQNIGERAFRYCVSLQSIEIPNTIQTIGNNAFIWCTSLTSVTIGSDNTTLDLTSIGDNAFGSTALDSVTIYCENNDAFRVPSIGSNAFGNNPNSLHIYVPWWAVQRFKDEWTEYANSIYPIS